MRVFDTNFTADLTIMEEGTELLKRINEGGNTAADYFLLSGLDQIRRTFLSRTCWTIFLPVNHPSRWFGALTKTYYAEKTGKKARRYYLGFGHALHRQKIRSPNGLK